MAVLKGHNRKYDLQHDVMLCEVSWLMYVRFLVHMQREEGKVNITDGINQVLGLSLILSFFIQIFFSLSILILVFRLG